MRTTTARQLLGLLVFFGPMSTGLQVEGEGGVGNYEFGGCSGQQYNVKAQSLAASVRLQTEAGFTATVEAAVVPGSIRSSQNSDTQGLVGQSLTNWGGDARVGWNWAYGGLDGGVALWNQLYDCCTPIDNMLLNDGKVLAFPSFSGWAGVPRYAYAWVSFLAEPAVLPSDIVPPIFIGIGHQDELLDLRAGVGDGFIFRGNVKVHRYFQPGIDVRYIDDHHWDAGINLRFSFDVFAAN